MDDGSKPVEGLIEDVGLKPYVLTGTCIGWK